LSFTGYILQVAMPGVNKEGLEIFVENRRTFELDPSIDTSKISAKIEQGVVTLTLQGRTGETAQDRSDLKALCLARPANLKERRSPDRRPRENSAARKPPFLDAFFRFLLGQSLARDLSKTVRIYGD
jgi:hypothetical protein